MLKVTIEKSDGSVVNLTATDEMIAAFCKNTGYRAEVIDQDAVDRLMGEAYTLPRTDPRRKQLFEDAQKLAQETVANKTTPEDFMLNFIKSQVLNTLVDTAAVEQEAAKLQAARLEESRKAVEAQLFQQ